MSEIIVPGEENNKPEFDFESGELGDQVKALKEKLGITDEPVEELSTEAVEARKEADVDAPASISGKDINWNDYELDERYAHFYPQAELIDTSQGFQWVVTIDEFRGASKTWSGRSTGRTGEPTGIGEYITWMTNGPEKWKIATILPDGGLVGVLFQRKVRIALPDPKLIEKEVVVPAPTDSELQTLESESVAWAGGIKAAEPAELVQTRLENVFEGKDEVSLATQAAKNAVKALNGPDFGVTTGLQEPDHLPIGEDNAGTEQLDETGGEKSVQ